MRRHKCRLIELLSFGRSALAMDEDYEFGVLAYDDWRVRP